MKALIKVYNNEILSINGDFSEFESGEEFINPQHEYSFDMDIFGEQSFFHRINRTFTTEGKSMLAAKLTNLPKSKIEIERKQKAISELEERDTFCHSFLAFGSLLNKNISFSIRNFHSSPIEKILIKKNIIIIAYISIFFLLLTSCLAYLREIPNWVPFIVFILQLISPIFLFKKMNKYTHEIGKLHKNTKQYSEIINLLKQTEFTSDLNMELKEKLFVPEDSIKAFKKLATILNQFDKRENAYALVILNGFFLNDLFLLIKYCNWKHSYLHRIEEWLAVLAEFEVLISFANMNFSNSQYAIPEIVTDGDTIIKAHGLGHPFIDKKKLVTNDFIIKKSNFSIITGANMAGKSTLLRSLGINYVMALNGMKVCAECFTIQIVRLFSSMRNTDNLASGISYFSAELNRIEQLINYIINNDNTLIILDEILKGTNSKDKLNGSIMFLEKIRNLPVSGVIATHDLALSELSNINPNIFQNFCFEIDLHSSQMYTYKIQNGVCKNLNATYLLNNIFSKISK